MQLTEKEIARIIGASFGAASPEKEAAHAIFGRIQEGIVWEKLVQMHYDPDNPEELAGWSEEDDGDYVVYILGDHEKIEPGHQYLVTVRRMKD